MPVFSLFCAHVTGILVALLMATGLGFAVFTYGTDDLKYGPTILCSILAAFLVLWHAWRTRDTAMPVTATTVSIAAFFLYLLVSVLWSTVFYTSMYFAVIFLLIPFLFFSGTLRSSSRTMLFFMAGGAAATVMAVMFWDIYQYIFMFGGEHGTRVKHPFLDPNNLAVFMNMALFPVLALAFWVRDKRLKTVMGLLAVLFFAALMATNSRTAFVAAGACFAVLMPVLIRQSRRPEMLAGGLVIAILIMVFTTNFIMKGALFDYLREVLTFDQSVSMHDRLALWLSALQMFKDHLWLGTGLATFFFYYPSYRQPTDNSDGYFVHMDPLQIGLETGIAGYILLYVFLICVLCRTIRALRAPAINPRDYLLVMGPFAGLLSVCLHMHMTFCLYLPAISIPVGILLALWYAATEHILNDRKAAPPTRCGRMALAVLVLIMVISIIWAGRATAGIYLNEKTFALIQSNRMHEAELYLEWEQRIAPDSYYRPYEQRANIGFTQLKGPRKTLEQRRYIAEEAIKNIDEAIKRQPRHGSLRNLKAMILYLAGEDAIPGSRQQMIEILRGILRHDPMMIDSRIGLAKILTEQGQFGQALRLLEEGMRWPRPKGVPDLNYITQTAQANLIMGNRERHAYLMQMVQERARAYGFTLQNAPQ